jgi:pimeloyl-ACP methyl ester carboxylesterase
MDLEVTQVGTGTPLVAFVHGVLDRGRSFEPVADLLDGDCRILHYDRRGYGTARHAPGVPADVHQHIEDLLAVLDGRRALVVGHSFGGMTAMGAAIRAPETVTGLVLYETAIPWAPGWTDVPMKRVFADPDPEDAGLRLMLGERMASMSAETLAGWRQEARAFIAEEGSVRTGTPPYDIATLSVPVTYGISGPSPLTASADYLRQQVPTLEVVTVPGAGHMAHRTDPAGFADLVRRALRRSDA